MAKKTCNHHRNFFPVYGRAWGQSLMDEARARQMTRTELVRLAVNSWLRQNPICGSGNPNKLFQDR